MLKKAKNNGFKLEFPALSENEAFARQIVCTFAARLDPTLEELSDLRVVVSEAVTNCVVHAYKGSNGVCSLSTPPIPRVSVAAWDSLSCSRCPRSFR